MRDLFDYVDPETGEVLEIEALPWPRFRRFDDGGRVYMVSDEADIVRFLAECHLEAECEACGCRLIEPDREQLVDIQAYPKVGIHFFCTRHFPYSFKSKKKRSFEPVQGENRYAAASAKRHLKH